MELRTLHQADADLSAGIHLEVLSMEFLPRLGKGFLTTYHRTWAASPAGLALAATDDEGRLIGVLLGSLDPAAHYEWMLRHAGFRLAMRLLAAALRHPRLARELLITRGARYCRAVLRRLVRRASPDSSTGRTGEITHLMVSPSARGTGAGRALVEETQRLARAAHLEEVVLVTPPDAEARTFYEHLGWEPDGAVTSRSGEEFVRFRRPLTGNPRSAGHAVEDPPAATPSL